MEVTFSKDAFNRYMIIDSGLSEADGREEISFEEKMLESRDSTLLLAFHMQSTDGCKKYYYDITGLTDLVSYLSQNKVGTAALRSMITSLTEVFSTMNRFLLEAESLLLELSDIYVDENEQKLHFAYVPGLGGSYGDGIRELAKALLGAVNYRQNDCVLMAYEFYRAAHLPDFSVRMLAEITGTTMADLSDTRGSADSNDTDSDASWQPGMEGTAEAAETVRQAQRAAAEDDHLNRWDSGTSFDMPEDERKCLKKDRRMPAISFDIKNGKSGMFIILAAAFIYCSSIAVMYISGYASQAAASFGIGTKYLVLAMMTVGFAALFLVWIIIRRKFILEEKASCNDTDDFENDSFDNSEIFSFKDMSGDTAGETCILGTAGGGETTVLGLEPAGSRPRLISADSNRTGDIMIMRMPAVIGSRRPNSQIIIDIPGISRSHAMIENGGEEYLISDLGSTNGTCLNGERLTSNRRYSLKKDDEVTFGDVTYTFEC